MTEYVDIASEYIEVGTVLEWPDGQRERVASFALDEDGVVQVWTEGVNVNEDFHVTAEDLREALAERGLEVASDG